MAALALAAFVLGGFTVIQYCCGSFLFAASGLLAVETALGLAAMVALLSPGFRRMHGAEHQIINTMEQLGRLPTMNELRATPRIHDWCGASLAVMVIVVVSGALVLSGAFVPFAVAVVGWGLVVALTLVKHPYWLRLALRVSGAVQHWLTTAPPTDREHRLALATMGVLMEARQASAGSSGTVRIASLS